MLIFIAVHNFDFLGTEVSFNQHWIAASVDLTLHLTYVINEVCLACSYSDEYWLAGCDAQSVVHIYQHVKGNNCPSSTDRGVVVLPEVAGSKHVQNGTTFLTDNTAKTVSFEFQTQFVVTPTWYNAGIGKSQSFYYHLVWSLYMVGIVKKCKSVYPIATLFLRNKKQ